MFEKNSTAGIEIKSVTHGVTEEVKLDFKASKATIEGRFPSKTLGFILLAITVFIGYVWISTSLLNALFENTAEGSIGYNLQMGVTLIGMLVLSVTLKILLESGEDKQKSDKFTRQRAFAKEQLGPWLEANGGIKESVWVAEDIMEGKGYVSEKDNTWNAFYLEFVSSGFNRQNQTLRIWRWSND